MTTRPPSRPPFPAAPPVGEHSAMSSTQLGLIAGLALGLAGAFGGFGAFVVVLLLGAIGLAVGRWAEGKLDLSELSGMVGRDRERRL